MLALIFIGYIQNWTWAIIRSSGKSDSDVADDMIPQLFQGNHFFNFASSFPCRDPPCSPPPLPSAFPTFSGRAVKVKRCRTGRLIPASRAKPPILTFVSPLRTIILFPECWSFLFLPPPPEETFIKLITTGMWIFLSRVGQNKECDRSSLLVKEASLQLLFKRQPTPSWHWVTLQTGIPQARTSPMLRAWDQGIHQMQSLALQPNCSIML